MSHLTLQLDGAELSSDQVDGNDAGWWSDDNLITVRGRTRTMSVRLPRRKPRVILERHGGNRGQLIIGGYTTITVAVRGSLTVLEELRRRVL